MNQNTNQSEWYKASQRSSSYENVPVSISDTKKQHVSSSRKPLRPGVKAALIGFGILLLIALSTIIFSGTGRTDIPLPQFPSSRGNWDGGYGPNDFGDYYSDDYTYTTGSGSNLPRGEIGTGVTLSLSSSEELEALSLQGVYDKCIDSVVSIVGEVRGYSGYYWGSGIVMTEDGYILTNAHVIEGTDSVTVCLSNGEEYEALLIGEDPISDIAVLKIDAEGLTAAEFGMSDELSVGDKVVALGNPIGEEFSGTMTDGIISAINRGITVGGHTMTLLQTNAALNGGNSGGPLINIYGQVVGITNMKMVTDYSSATIEGIGFAIPTTIVKAIADELIENGRPKPNPSFGFSAYSVTKSMQDASEYDFPSGVFVVYVNADSDAYEKGLARGDIITAVNGIFISSVEDVNVIKSNFGVGDTLTLTIFRDGESFDVDIMLFDAAATN